MQALIGVIGDFNSSNPYHPATNAALKHAAEALNVHVRIEWIPTDALIASEGGQRDAARSSIVGFLKGYDALFASPGSPYNSMEGALNAIRFARENGVCFTGT